MVHLHLSLCERKQLLAALRRGSRLIAWTVKSRPLAARRKLGWIALSVLRVTPQIRGGGFLAILAHVALHVCLKYWWLVPYIVLVGVFPRSCSWGAVRRRRSSRR
jgi:hypothetical protein